MEDTLKAKTRFLRCRQEGEGKLDGYDECLSDYSTAGEIDQVHGGKDRVEAYIWDKFIRGFNGNNALTQMVAAGLINNISIYYDGYSEIEDGFTSDVLMKEYDYSVGAYVRSVVKGSCFQEDLDGAAVYEAERSSDGGFFVDIGPFLEFVDYGTGFYSFDQWKRSAERWQREIKPPYTCMGDNCSHGWHNSDGSIMRVWLLGEDLDSNFMHAASRMGDRVSRADDDVLYQCEGDIAEGLENAYRYLSEEKIYKRMEKNTKFSKYLKQTEKYSIYLQSWLSIMLRDMTWRSRLAEAVIKGEWRLPTVDEVRKQIKDEGGYAWDLRDRYTDILDEFEDALRSPAFEYVVNEGAGDLDLMQILFLGIDEVDPIGSASSPSVTARGE